MRANDRISTTFLNQSQRHVDIAGMEAENAPVNSYRENRWNGISSGTKDVEKDPYVNLGRAVLLQAHRDAQREITKSNRAEVMAAREFMDLSTPNADRDFWRDVARV